MLAYWLGENYDERSAVVEDVVGRITEHCHQFAVAFVRREDFGAKYFRPIGIFLQQRLVLNDDKGPRLRIDGTRGVNRRPEERIYCAFTDGFVCKIANRSSAENDVRQLHDLTLLQ